MRTYSEASIAENPLLSAAGVVERKSELKTCLLSFFYNRSHLGYKSGFLAANPLVKCKNLRSSRSVDFMFFEAWVNSKLSVDIKFHLPACKRDRSYCSSAVAVHILSLNSSTTQLRRQGDRVRPLRFFEKRDCAWFKNFAELSGWLKAITNSSSKQI